MARELILYVGLHKTASSSIQHTCAQNRARLRAAGFAYPVFAMNGAEETNHTRLLKNLFRRDPGRIGLGGRFAAGDYTWTASDREQLKTRLASTFASTNDRVILAAEGLSTYSEEELRDFAEWLSSIGFRPRVICHIRHLKPWLNSMIAQRVRGQVLLTIPEAVQELVQTGGLVRPRVEVIRSVFPQAEFFSHEAAVAHRRGPPGFFFDTIGLGETRGLRWVIANEGASNLAVRTLSFANERFGRTRWPGAPEELQRFARQPGLLAIHDLRGARFTMLESEAAPLAALIGSENAWLGEQFGPAFHDPAPAFPQEVVAPSAEEKAALKAAIEACEPELRQHLLRALAPPTGIEPVSSA